MNKRIGQWLLLLILVVGMVVALVYREVFHLQALTAWVTQSGIWGPIVFMLIYALATLLFLPGSVITLAGGVIFGPLWGTVYNLTGATLGASLAFLLARYLAADWVEQKSEGRLKQLKHGVEREGWRFVAFVRLVPLFPFNVLNYALGLTKIPFSQYLTATYLFMLPGAMAYTYLGYVGREAATGAEGMIEKGLMALTLLAVVAFLPYFINKIRQQNFMNTEELKQNLQDHNQWLLLDVRSSDDFIGELGHISGAVNIPLEELKQRQSELQDYLERPVAIICTTDRRSSQAERMLSGSGFGEVVIVAGGMSSWNQQGYAVE
jgi:uncharacterized membrane protein YdjX (TVP38/TMEM64 family)/rhodanese-related sulfurtransferase